VSKRSTLIEEIHVLQQAMGRSSHQTNREPSPKDPSDVDVMPDGSSDFDAVAEFAGDALATLEDWEAERTLEDLRMGRTKIH
jgi:hypothetical protein